MPLDKLFLWLTSTVFCR